MRLLRRTILVAAAAVLMACGTGNGTPAAGAMALGPENAKVTVIEYASTMCPHCAHLHETVYPQLKQNYIDTGKIRYEFREFATAPRDVTYAQFLVARCAGTTPEQYMSVIDMFMRQQEAVRNALMAGQGREKLMEIAGAAGLSSEQFAACVNDEAALERIRAGEEAAVKQFKINSTPTLIINGTVVPNRTTDSYSYENIARLIDEQLAK